MTDPAERPPTYEDVLAAPEHLVAEILGGELVLSPRPSPAHARTSTRLAMAVGGFDHDGDGPGGWWILFEPELHLEAEGRPIVPDLAGWRVERMPQLPDSAYFMVAPDGICEVLSRSTAARDRADKMPVYAQAGVGHAWLVDPLLETVEVYSLDADRRWILRETHRGERVVRVPPFDAVEIDLAPL